MSQVINIDPDVLGGTPVFMGTRVPIASLFDAIKHDRGIHYFLEDFPSVPREQIEALLEVAESRTLAGSADS